MNINIRGLFHRYDTQIINGIDLDLSGVTAVGLIGASGSGKSTLLRLMSGIESPTQGTIKINGTDVADDVYRRSVGFVFQNHNLFPHLTLLENITLVLEKTRGQTRREAQDNAFRYLELLHLCDQRNKLPKHCSGGQAQRAAIARALSINPEVLFLDEPTASLDPVLTYEVLSAVEELRGFGTAFVFASHVMSFVRDFADFVLFLDTGTIAEQGQPEILASPETAGLSSFMARVP